jgi:hypothetical protein
MGFGVGASTEGKMLRPSLPGSRAREEKIPKSRVLPTMGGYVETALTGYCPDCFCVSRSRFGDTANLDLWRSSR